MNWFESLIYGVVSGFTAFLPISSDAHHMILLKLFGVDTPDPIRNILIYIAVVISIFTGCRTYLDQLQRERKTRYPRGSRTKPRLLADYRLVRTAAIPMLLGILLISFVVRSSCNLLLTALFLVINAVVLFIPERMMQGNKDARMMASLDGLLIGSAAGLSALPGISCVGMVTSVSVMRGADRQNALNWAFLLCIPAYIVLIGIELVLAFSGIGLVAFWPNLLGYLLGAVGACISGYFAIVFMKFLTVRTGYSGFAYYTIGAALFSFLLYLTVA